MAIFRARCGKKEILVMGRSERDEALVNPGLGCESALFERPLLD
jgi:hypothetical protein